jgi:hypothetical protein
MKNVFVRFILLLRVSYFFASMSNYAIHLGPVCLLYYYDVECGPRVPLFPSSR